MTISVCPLSARSAWSRDYAISADARLMRAPNTAKPRQSSAAPTPAKPAGSGA
ncbi:hypothetical protein MalM25_06840 [Planctomycetes bacterium MalM25]|nr:hypothetical protein MalM25_06840 [Planctomycetes bacterium MalM25]